MDEFTKEKKCYDLFRELGINPAYKGYSYLMTAVIDRLDAEKNNIKRSVGDSYAVVSDKFGCNYQNAERNIRHVCYRVFETASEEKKLLLQDIFGQKTAVTNSKFIACLCEYLKYSW